MNLGKNGRPFKYPHSLRLFLGTLRVVFSLPYRQLEGLARRLGKLISIPSPLQTTPPYLVSAGLKLSWTWIWAGV